MSRALKSVIRADGKSVYCGPAALMAVTGRSYEDVRARINQYRTRKPNTAVTGMWTHEIVWCLDRWGVDCKKHYLAVPKKRQPTLGQFLKNRSIDLIDKTIIIAMTEHFVTVKGHMLVDNNTHVPVYVWGGPHLKARVKKYIVID